MNLLGTFSFGRIIKTFLPGFVIVFSLVLLLDALISLIGLAPGDSLLRWIAQNSLLTSFVAIPLSLICGIFSNMVLFVYLTDSVIRRPFRKGNEELFDLQKEIFDHLYSKINSRRILPQELSRRLRKSEAFDLEYLLFPIIPLDKLIFLQESYWYYLEFQINMCLATVLFTLGSLFWSLTNYFSLGITWWRYLAALVVGLLIATYLVRLSIRAARRNYARHVQKLLNLLVGSVIFCEMKKESAALDGEGDTGWPEIDGA
ncbi:MAG TPA: hypothetical protein VN493_17365 [Thermoanaerobaculia bacterium]|nr:hypothetical protein [Thermoanaerobaculia bacterium]